MAKFDYAQAAKTALRLIAKFGQTMNMHAVASSYDAPTGVRSDVVLSTNVVTAVVLPSSTQETFATDDSFAEDLRLGRLRFLTIAARGLTFAPEPGKYLEFEGGFWEIHGVTPLSPAGVPVIYNVVCRISNLDALVPDFPFGVEFEAGVFEEYESGVTVEFE